MLNVSILAVSLCMQAGQTTTPQPPHQPNRWLIPLNMLAGITAMVLLILALSGCSTAPAVTPSWTPAQSGLVKSAPLPKLADDSTQPDDAKSTVGVPELVEDNFTIVKMYRALAKRHDTLVDDVMQHLKDQTK